MSFDRFISDSAQKETAPAVLDEWLEDLTNEREMLLIRLRWVEKKLIEHKKIRRATVAQARLR